MKTKRSLGITAMLLAMLLCTACTAGPRSGSATPQDGADMPAQTDVLCLPENAGTETPDAAAAAALSPAVTAALSPDPTAVFDAIRELPIRFGACADLDGDGVSEIITVAGHSEADALLSIYALREDEIRLLGSVNGGHTALYTDGAPGLIVQYAHMDTEKLDRLLVDGSALAREVIAEQHEVTSYTQNKSWLPLKSWLED